jgi:transposase
VGPDLSLFRPNQEIGGGKVPTARTGKNASRLAKAFRMAANSLLKSESALGLCFRRLRAKLGAPKAIAAIAHKIARIVYHLVTTRELFDPTILLRQQEQQRNYRESRIRKQAAHLGFKLVPTHA